MSARHRSRHHGAHGGQRPAAGAPTANAETPGRPVPERPEMPETADLPGPGEEPARLGDESAGPGDEPAAPGVDGDRTRGGDPVGEAAEAAEPVAAAVPEPRRRDARSAAPAPRPRPARPPAREPRAQRESHETSEPYEQRDGTAVDEDAAAARMGDAADRKAACTVAQLRRFIKSRPYVPLHELRRRFAIEGFEDEVGSFPTEKGTLYVGLPQPEAALLGELVRSGEVGCELLLDPSSPAVVGVFPMRPVSRG